MSGAALLSTGLRRQLLIGFLPVTAVTIAAGVWTIADSRPAQLREVSAAMLVPASGTTRPIEVRLTGLQWAPFLMEKSEPRQSARTRGDSASAREDQQQALSDLLSGHPAEAVSLLERASAGNNPSALSDLAAAYFELADRRNLPQYLANALSAADRAVTLAPNSAEALFNRALILERLGFRIEARRAWSRHLANEPQGGWADEARKHLAALVPERPFLEVLDSEYDRVGSDPSAAAAIYERDRFAARGQGVVEILGRWGGAAVLGDERNAARHLGVARQLGHAVARGGDLTLEESVAAIDRAGALRTRLAAAHADFRTGMAMYRKTQPADAEPLLRRAAAVFREAGSPCAFPAALWAANSRYLRGQRDDAEREIAQLLGAVPARFPAYRAFMLWQLANAHKERGESGAAIDLYEQSAAIFQTLGETGNVAYVRDVLAGIYDKTGDSATAWQNRMSSLSGHGIRSDEVEERAVWNVIEAAIIRRDWQVASSFMTIYLGVEQRLGNDFESANALLLRAVVRDRLNDAAGVRNDLAEAAVVASRVTDPAYQEMLRVAEWRSTAMLHSTPPATAEASLTHAIDYESTLGSPSALPGLLLLRATARRHLGNRRGALDDVERGIEQMEKHRESLPAGAARWGAFHSASDLFEEGVRLALAAGDPHSAFRFAERGRARSLLDTYGATSDADLRHLPPQTILVEYATLPDAVVIFVASRSGIHFVQVAVNRNALIADVDAFTDALHDDRSADAMRLGRSLYERLIQPVEPQLAGIATVAFVADAATSTVPFGAVVDAHGNYLLEHHAVVVAPSAAAFVASTRSRGASAPRSALVVTASAGTDDLGHLQFVDSEAKDILSTYQHASRIDEDSPQFEELAERGPSADVIHFSGHAVGDRRGYEPASLVLSDRGKERRVGVADISRLHLNHTSVVVLAGCSTARGPRRAADGVMSVAYGFLTAGVPSAVATLWPIADKLAPRFFSRLHTRLASGVPAADAVREVQLDAIRRGDLPASMWAAVQVIGR